MRTMTIGGSAAQTVGSAGPRSGSTKKLCTISKYSKNIPAISPSLRGLEMVRERREDRRCPK